MKSTREVDPENFPFPAVTICPNIFANDSSINFMSLSFANKDQRRQFNLSKEQCTAVAANLHWCDPGSLHLVTHYCKNFKYDEIDVVQTMRKTASRVKMY